MKARHPHSEPATNLDELLARVENDRELLRELVVIFKNDFPPHMSTLRLAIAQIDLKTTERSSHTLKGMFLSLAAARAAASAGRLEQLARARDTVALPSALALLDKEVALLIPELESHLVKIET
jgi:two-component system, sensor histidine kinase and response regulator